MCFSPHGSPLFPYGPTARGSSTVFPAAGGNPLAQKIVFIALRVMRLRHAEHDEYKEKRSSRAGDRLGVDAE